jgi:Kef-type K+ transport system membrane component KefB
MAITRTYIGRCQYDFDIDGGAAVVITPANNFNLPIGAMIIGAWTDIKTTLASDGSATIAIAAAGTVIKAATAFDNAAYVGIDAHLARTSAALTTAAGPVTFTVATAALTAGKVDIYVEYILAD